MKKEDKDLLLKDLCARLPYGVKMWFPSAFAPIVLDEFILSVARRRDEEFKPYLRPMSSMTEEEKGELWFLLTEGRTNIELNSNGQLTTRENIELGFNYPFVCPEGSTLYVDWLNAHHFDYRGLIEKGLAIAVTEENNPYKTKDKDE